MLSAGKEKRRHRGWALVRLVVQAVKPGCGVCRSGLMVLPDLWIVNQTFNHLVE